MKKYIYLMLMVVLAGIYAGCSKDEPFENGGVRDTGSLLTTSLGVTLKSDYGPRSLKSRMIRAAAPNVDDFTVEFYRAGKTEPEASYLYSKMPEIITLPVGDYTAKAFYGENPDAAWESPYYEGDTRFTIKADEITEDVNPIECTFANIRVSVYFDDVLKESMGPDCKVTVKVGRSGELDFTLSDEYERSGYFAYVEGSNTLVATFSGTVDGVYTSENKAEIQVEKGKHYQIRFKMYDAGAEDPGSIRPGEDQEGIVNIVPDVTTENIDGTVDSGETPEEDNWRPQEGEIDNPGKDEPGTDNPTPGNGPEISAQSPFDISKVNEIEIADGVSKNPVVLIIHSDATTGIEQFTVTIDSETLTPSILKDVGLSDKLDLINPGELEEGLRGLKFPVGEDVKGKQDVRFDITEFVPLLPIYGEATHKFVVYVKDANGATTRTLILHNN